MAIALMVACAVAFMPLLSGQVFAASKVTGVKAKVSGTTATVTWKKVKKAKQYTVKVTGAQAKTVKAKKPKAVLKDLAAGDYTVKVKASKGKKTGWSKAAKFKIEAQAAAVTITGVANVGATLTADVLDKDGNPITEGVTYQWYRVNNLTGVVAEISGATEATYQIVAADGGGQYTIFVEATAGGATVKSAPTKAVTNVRALGSVEIALPNEHTAPMVGDVLEAVVTDTVGDAVKTSVTYQWYANGAKITGATDATYTVAQAQKGKVITVEVKAVKNSGYEGELTSTATAAVIESTVPTSVAVKFSAAAPYVGETISAEFGPEGAVDADATYQWYRGDNKIAGATAATYTVQAADAGKTLKVVATLSAKDANGNDIVKTSAVTPNVSPKALEGAVAAITSNNADKTVFTTTNTASVAITVNKVADTAYTYEWFIDSADPANKLYTAVYADPDHEQTAASGATLNLGGTYYLEKVTDATNTVDLVGHKIVVVASTTAANANGQGTVEAVTGDIVKLNLSGVAIDKDSDNVVATKTTFTATPGKVNDENPDVTYKWFYNKTRTANVDATGWIEIAGETGDTYKVTEADLDNAALAFKVEITGVGNYYGTAAAASQFYRVNPADTAQAITLTINGENAVNVQAGDVLTAGTSIAAADQYVTFSWTYTPAGGSAQAAVAGTTFTVPADAAANSTVVLTATSSVTDYTIAAGVNATATVQGKLTNAKLTSDGSKAATTQDPGYDAVATPHVGETLTASATGAGQYEFIADDKTVQAKSTTATYTIKAADLGKKISVKIYGGTGFEGAEATVETGDVVKALAEIQVKAGSTVLGNDSAGKVDDTLTASVVTYKYSNGAQVAASGANYDLNSEMTFIWKLDGQEVSGNVENHPEQYKIQPEDEGKTISCEAVNANVSVAKDKSMIWDNGLLIGPKGL